MPSTRVGHGRQKDLRYWSVTTFECQRCKKKGRVSKGEVVHHIKELKDYPKLGMTDENLVTVCSRCHNIIHERFEGKTTEPRIKIPERW